MTTVFAVIALVAGIAGLGMFIALHLMRSEYNPVEHAVSDYAVGSTRRLTSVMTWTTAVMWACLAVAVGVGLVDWEDRIGIVVCLAALAVVFVVLPKLPTDLEGEKTTIIGRLHLLAAILWFALAYGCMGNFVRLMDGTPLGAVLAVLSWVGLVSLVALVASMVIRPLRRWTFGISERVFILTVRVFYLLVAYGLVAM